MVLLSPMRYRFEGFTLDAPERRLTDPRGREISCAPKTLDALLLLVQNAGQLVRREQFHDQLWPQSIVADETLGKLIWQVRKALNVQSAQALQVSANANVDEETDRPGLAERMIETVPRHGYRFCAAVRTEPSELPPPVAFAAPINVENAPVSRQSRSSFVAVIVLAIVGSSLFGWYRLTPITEEPPQVLPPRALPSVVRGAIVGAGVDPWVGEALAAALALELGLDERPLVGAGAVVDSAEALQHSLTAASSDKWIWQIGVEFGEPLRVRLAADQDARPQIQQALDQLRLRLGLPVVGSAQQANRDAMLPRRWQSLRSYSEASQALMRRDGKRAIELLQPMLEAEPRFVPGWQRLARALYLQARDPESARAARQGLSVATQVPAALRLALEITLAEAEGRFDEAYERALALHQLAPVRYEAALTAARLAGHGGHLVRFDQLIAIARKLGPEFPEVELLDSLIALRGGEHHRALVSAEAAANKALALQWTGIAAEARINAARAHGQLGRFSEGLEELAQARPLVAESDPALAAQMALVEGNLLIDLGRFDQAELALSQAELWYRPRASLFELSAVVDVQAALAALQGNLARARQLTDEFLQLADASGDRYMAVAAAVRMAQAYLDAGEVAVATRWFSDASQRAESLNNPHLLAGTLLDWAFSAWQAGSDDEARAASTRALEAALAGPHWQLASRSATLLAEIALPLGQAEDFQSRLRQARDYAARSESEVQLALVQRLQAELEWRCGRLERAQAYLDTARRLLDSQSSRSAQLGNGQLLSIELLTAGLALAGQDPEQTRTTIERAQSLLSARSPRLQRVELALVEAQRLYATGDPSGAIERLQALGELSSRGLHRAERRRSALLMAMRANAPVDGPDQPAPVPALCTVAD